MSKTSGNCKFCIADPQRFCAECNACTVHCAACGRTSEYCQRLLGCGRKDWCLCGQPVPEEDFQCEGCGDGLENRCAKCGYCSAHCTECGGPLRGDCECEVTNCQCAFDEKVKAKAAAAAAAAPAAPAPPPPESKRVHDASCDGSVLKSGCPECASLTLFCTQCGPQKSGCDCGVTPAAPAPPPPPASAPPLPPSMAVALMAKAKAAEPAPAKAKAEDDEGPFCEHCGNECIKKRGCGYCTTHCVDCASERLDCDECEECGCKPAEKTEKKKKKQQPKKPKAAPTKVAATAAVAAAAPRSNKRGAPAAAVTAKKEDGPADKKHKAEEKQPVATEIASMSYYIAAQRVAEGKLLSAEDHETLTLLEQVLTVRDLATLGERTYRITLGQFSKLLPPTPARAGERLVGLADCLERLCATAIGLEHGMPTSTLQYCAADVSSADREKLAAAHASNARFMDPWLMQHLRELPLEKHIERAVLNIRWVGVGEAERAVLKARCLPDNYKQKHLPSMSSKAAQMGYLPAQQENLPDA